MGVLAARFSALAERIQDAYLDDDMEKRDRVAADVAEMFRMIADLEDAWTESGKELRDMGGQIADLMSKIAALESSAALVAEFAEWELATPPTDEITDDEKRLSDALLANPSQKPADPTP